MTHRLQNIIRRNGIVSKEVRTVMFNTTKLLSTLMHVGKSRANFVVTFGRAKNILFEPCADRSQEKKNRVRF